MYDLLLVTTILLPVAAPHLASLWMCRGMAVISADARARRSYRLSWLVSFCMLAQMALLFWVAGRWGKDMLLLDACQEGIVSGVQFLSAHMSQGWVTSLVVLLSMAVVAIDFWVMALALFRMDRLAKGLPGGTACRSKTYLRSFAGSLLPVLIWIVFINAVPAEVSEDPVTASLLLIAFIAMQFALAPFLIELSLTTAPLGNPAIEAMSRTLCADARVRFGGIRLIKYGEQCVANAMVCGLLPWYRRIYVSDRMLEVFSPEEVRASNSCP